jgi:hypothetical protein
MPKLSSQEYQFETKQIQDVPERNASSSRKSFAGASLCDRCVLTMIPCTSSPPTSPLKAQLTRVSHTDSIKHSRKMNALKEIWKHTALMVAVPFQREHRAPFRPY